MFKILDKVCTPRRGTKYSAYVDLFAREDVVVGAGETKVVPLGVKIDIRSTQKIAYDNIGRSGLRYLYNFLKSHYLEVALRSSLGVKGLIIPNGIGIIDLDYPDEIGLIVHNPINRKNIQLIDHQDGTTNIRYESFYVKKGDRVAQATLKGHKGFLLGYESDVIRDEGYGSTGK